MAGIGGDFLNDLVAVSKVAAVDGRRARVAAYIKTAVIKVTPGANGEMIVNMNGRDYVVRGPEAAAFRKEYIAIQRPEAKVNALVEKYMNALQPMKKQTVPVAPGVAEKEQQETRAKGLADADNYWQGKGAPTPQEEKRYMGSTPGLKHAAYTTFPNEEIILEAPTGEVLIKGDTAVGRRYIAVTADGYLTDYPLMYEHNKQVVWDNPEWFSNEFKASVAEKLRNEGSEHASKDAALVDHKEENKGQAPGIEPLTGSSDGEFSDITGAENTDLSKMGDQELSLGDLVEIKGDLVPDQIFEVGFVRDGNVKLQDPKTHERISQGYAKNWIPVGSLKYVGTPNPEGSRLSSKKADAATLAPALQEGDEVRGRVGANEFVGTIESINGNKAVVKSPKGPKRTFDLKDLKLESEVESERAHDIQEWKDEDKNLSEAEKTKKRDDRIENSVNVQNPTGSWAELAAQLNAQDYTLRLNIPPDGKVSAEQRAAQYAEWTGGEELNEDCVTNYARGARNYGGWRLKFTHHDGLAYPAGVPVTPMGTNEGVPSTTPRFISTGKTVRMDYEQGIAELVKAGLRMRCGNSTQELRASMATDKKACDACAQIDEEVQLPTALPVEGEGSKMLPPPATALPEAEKEAADGKRPLVIGELQAMTIGQTAQFGDYMVSRTQANYYTVHHRTGNGDKPVMSGSASQVMSMLPKAQVPLQEQMVGSAEKEAGFNFFFPGQVLKEFYPEVQHEIVDYPNDNNSPMIEDIDLDAAMETPILGSVRMYADDSNYVSTSPGAVGIGRDGKPQVLDGAPLRKENDIRGGMFMDEFHQQYDGVPGALLAVASKVAAADEANQFQLFLKKVCGEIAATMVAAFKVTSRPLLNQVPGVGEVQLAQVEQPSALSSFNIVNTGSRVKYLLDKMNDSDLREAITKARAQAAVWLDDPNGGYVYEVFIRAESIDTDSMVMKYKFITGTKESE